MGTDPTYTAKVPFEPASVPGKKPYSREGNHTGSNSLHQPLLAVCPWEHRLASLRYELLSLSCGWWSPSQSTKRIQWNTLDDTCISSTTPSTYQMLFSFTYMYVSWLPGRTFSTEIILANWTASNPSAAPSHLQKKVKTTRHDLQAPLLSK